MSPFIRAEASYRKLAYGIFIPWFKLLTGSRREYLRRLVFRTVLKPISVKVLLLDSLHSRIFRHDSAKPYHRP